MLSIVVTWVVLLNNTVKDSCPYRAHVFCDHICATSRLPGLQSCFSHFSLEAPQSPQPHIWTRIYYEQNQKLSPSPDMASFSHHSFTQLNHLVLSLHLLSTLLQIFSQMSHLLCISKVCPQVAHRLSPKLVQRPLTWPVCLWLLSFSLCSVLTIIAEFNFY